jgi:protein-S-isoprenylcysteine O-methyltransferase Ste14
MAKTTQQKIFQHRLHSALFYWLWLPALVIGSGLIFDSWLGLRRWHHGILANSLALIVLAIGLALIAWSDRDIKHLGHGTPSPTVPARSLVTGGSYRLCRHPMFLGYDLAAIAIIFLTGSPAMFVVNFPLMLIWQVRFLHKEEHILRRRFLEEYARYQAKVPFLIPFLPPSQR